MRAFLLALLLASVALAGCTGGNNADGDVAADSAGDAALDDGMVEDAGPPILYDVDVLDTWGDDETQRVLFDGTVEIQGGCSPGPVANGEVWYGCTNAYLPEGTLVPWGTANIRVDADASSAQREGTWSPYLLHTRTRSWEYGGWGEGEPTDEDSGTWHFPVEQQDWDLPDQSESETWVHIMGHGGGVHYMQGSVAVTITAERDPDWVPEPIYDPWQDPDNHLIVDEGVARLYQDNLSWQSSGELIFDVWTEELGLQEPIPLRTSHLIVSMVWQPVDCAPQDECAMTAQLRREGVITGISDDDTIAAEADTHRIVAWVSPEHFGPDRFDAATTAYDVRLFFSDCGAISTAFDAAFSPFGTDGSCNSTEGVVQADVEVHVLIEAWRDDFDLDAFKQRLGV